MTTFLPTGIFPTVRRIASHHRNDTMIISETKTHETDMSEKELSEMQPTSLAEATAQIIVAYSCLERMVEGLAIDPRACQKTALDLLRAALPPLLEHTAPQIASCCPEVFLPPFMNPPQDSPAKGQNEPSAP